MPTTVQDLAKYVADYFNESIEDWEFDGFQEMVDCYDWSSSDIKEEIYYTLKEIRDRHIYDTSNWDFFDDCSVEVDGVDYSYRQFKRIMMQFIEKK